MDGKEEEIRDKSIEALEAALRERSEDKSTLGPESTQLLEECKSLVSSSVVPSRLISICSAPVERPTAVKGDTVIDKRNFLTRTKSPSKKMKPITEDERLRRLKNVKINEEKISRLEKTVPATMIVDGVSKIVGQLPELPCKVTAVTDHVHLEMPEESKGRLLPMRGNKNVITEKPLHRVFTNAEIRLITNFEKQGVRCANFVTFECEHPYCEHFRPFYSLLGLAYHCTLRHTVPKVDEDGDKKYPCLLCIRELRLPNGVKLHMDRVHPDVKETHLRSRLAEPKKGGRKKVEEVPAAKRSRSLSCDSNSGYSKRMYEARMDAEMTAKIQKEEKKVQRGRPSRLVGPQLKVSKSKQSAVRKVVGDNAEGEDKPPVLTPINYYGLEDEKEDSDDDMQMKKKGYDSKESGKRSGWREKTDEPESEKVEKAKKNEEQKRKEKEELPSSSKIAVSDRRSTRTIKKPRWMTDGEFSDGSVMAEEREKKEAARKEKEKKVQPVDDSRLQKTKKIAERQRNLDDVYAIEMRGASEEDEDEPMSLVLPHIVKKENPKKEENQPTDSIDALNQVDRIKQRKARKLKDVYATEMRGRSDDEDEEIVVSNEAGQAAQTGSSRKRKQNLKALKDDSDEVLIVSPSKKRINLAIVPVYMDEKQQRMFFDCLIRHRRENDSEQEEVENEDDETKCYYECPYCGKIEPNMREGRRHMVGHVRAIRMQCTLCGAGAFFNVDMRRHLMLRGCPNLSKAPANMVRSGTPCMSPSQADELTVISNTAIEGKPILVSGKIVSVENITPHFPDPVIEEKMLGPSRESPKKLSPVKQPYKVIMANMLKESEMAAHRSDSQKVKEAASAQSDGPPTSSQSALLSTSSHPMQLSLRANPVVSIRQQSSAPCSPSHPTQAPRRASTMVPISQQSPGPSTSSQSDQASSPVVPIRGSPKKTPQRPIPYIRDQVNGPSPSYSAFKSHTGGGPATSIVPTVPRLSTSGQSVAASSTPFVTASRVLNFAKAEER